MQSQQSKPLGSPSILLGACKAFTVFFERKSRIRVGVDYECAGYAHNPPTHNNWMLLSMQMADFP